MKMEKILTIFVFVFFIGMLFCGFMMWQCRPVLVYKTDGLTFNERMNLLEEKNEVHYGDSISLSDEEINILKARAYEIMGNGLCWFGGLIFCFVCMAICMFTSSNLLIEKCVKDRK